MQSVDTKHLHLKLQHTVNFPYWLNAVLKSAAADVCSRNPYDALAWLLTRRTVDKWLNRAAKVRRLDAQTALAFYLTFKQIEKHNPGLFSPPDSMNTTLSEWLGKIDRKIIVRFDSADDTK